MRLLLDTHILLAVIEKRMDGFSIGIQRLLVNPDSTFYVSAASLWEIAIKSRLGKLHIAPGLDALPALIVGLGIQIVAVNEHHAVAAVEPEPLTRDPFDRMLLAQCEVENLHLVTIDRALIGHRLCAKAT